MFDPTPPTPRLKWSTTGHRQPTKVSIVNGEPVEQGPLSCGFRDLVQPCQVYDQISLALLPNWFEKNRRGVARGF
jgi:hypothetical protein